MSRYIYHSGYQIFSLIFILFILTIFSPCRGQEQKDLEKIYQATNRKALHDLGLRLAAQADSSKAIALKAANKKGWLIKKEFESGKIIELKGLDHSGRPVYFSTTNLNAAKTVSANKVWPGGVLGLNLSGSGIVLREWDAGVVRPTHQELVGRITVGDNATSLADHSTHVGGTMLATGIVANAHGMGNQATLRDFDWWSDYAEMTTEAANGALLSNHSYIYATGWTWGGSIWYWYGDPNVSQTTDYLYGFYMEDAATVDQIAFDAPYYLVCKAAGNDRLNGPSTQPVTHYVYDGTNWILSNTVRDLNGGPNGWDCISAGFGVSKNIMTVGAVYSIPNGYSSPADVVFASFSGTGPTDDGRIKPDLVDDGIGLYSTLSGSNTSYGSMSGTSMATPNMCGSLSLLQEHYHNLHGTYMRASTLKGLAIHTADEAGSYPGPDYKFGWGLLDIATAANALSQVCNTLVLEDTLTNGNTFTLNLNAKGTEPLVATLCWTDPAGTPPPPSLNPPDLMLVNDLDMRIDGNAHKPYILDPLNPTAAATTGDNFRDNVEKIYIQSPGAGSHPLTITHKNSLTNGYQVFSLIVTGLNTNFYAGSAGNDQTICSGTAPLQLHGIPPTGGISPYTYQWQSSSDNVTFTNIPGATGLTYQPGILTSTGYYRMIQTSSGSCGNVTTNTITITVMPSPVPVITGPDQVCLDSIPVTYSTEAGMSSYIWVIIGGTIISGAGTHEVTVIWSQPGVESVSVNYTNSNSCSASSPTVKAIIVMPLPVPWIIGEGSVCAGPTPVTYSTQQGMADYIWTISPGGTIISGAGTYQIGVTWNSAGNDSVTLTMTDANSCTAAHPGVKYILVKAVPPTPLIMASGDTITSNASSGNQWYYEGNPIPGAINPSYHATNTGWYWDIVTIDSCASDTSNNLYVIMTARQELNAENFSIFPVPNNGVFTATFISPSQNVFSSQVFNKLGQLIYEKTGIMVNKIFRQTIDLRPVPAGLYNVVIRSNEKSIARKILISY